MMFDDLGSGGDAKEGAGDGGFTHTPLDVEDVVMEGAGDGGKFPSLLKLR